MKSYAELHVFTPRDLELHGAAERLVSYVPGFTLPGEEEPIRCHELARAVGRILDLEVQDGRYGFVEHSWLWTEKPDWKFAKWRLPTVLDVYVPGGMPQVQLHDCGSTGLPARYTFVSLSDLVIHYDVIDELVRIMKGALHLTKEVAGP